MEIDGIGRRCRWSEVQGFIRHGELVADATTSATHMRAPTSMS